MFIINLNACGNPDHGENPSDNIVNGSMVPHMIGEADTIDEIINIARKFIEDFDLGASNWCGGEIYNKDTNSMVGWMSYNGRIWSEKR